jgi:hypothetical protein
VLNRAFSRIISGKRPFLLPYSVFRDIFKAKRGKRRLMMSSQIQKNLATKRTGLNGSVDELKKAITNLRKDIAKGECLTMQELEKISAKLCNMIQELVEARRLAESRICRDKWKNYPRECPEKL